MVINETKEEFGLKLLNHYTKLMTEYNDSKDEKTKHYAFSILLKQNKNILDDLCYSAK